MSRYPGDPLDEPMAPAIWAALAAVTIVAFFLLSGCTSLESTIYVDQRFTADEEAEIAEAAAAWETATGGAVHFDLVFGVPAIGTRASRRREIVRLTPDEAAASEFYEIRDDRESAAVRRGDGYRIVLVAPERLDGWGLATVVMHELGHTLNLQHVAERDALMSGHPLRAIERFAAEGCLSAADIKELIRVDVDMSRAIECQPLPTSTGVLAQ